MTATLNAMLATVANDTATVDEAIVGTDAVVNTLPDTTLDTQDSTAAVSDAPVPTHTAEQAAKTLTAFGKAIAAVVDGNYNTAPLAYRYIQEYLGCNPGKATASSAKSRLVGEWLQHDEETLALDEGKARRLLGKRLDMLLNTHAVATLIGTGEGIAKGDGTAKGRGKGKRDGKVAWGMLREFNPLVEREASDHLENWTVRPGISDECKALLAEVVSSGLSRADVVKQVRILRAKSHEYALTLDLPAAERSYHTEQLVTWGGKVKADEEKADEGKADESNPTEAPAHNGAAPTVAPTAPETSDSSDDDEGEGKAERKPKGDAPVSAPTAEQLATLTPNAVAEQLFGVICGHANPNSVICRLLGLIAEAGPVLSAKLSPPVLEGIRKLVLAD